MVGCRYTELTLDVYRSVPSVEQLRQHLGGLPQELYDAIFDTVFTAKPGRRTINNQYKPPAELQVSRATRKQFAKSYYSDSAYFKMSSAYNLCHLGCEFSRCSKWLESLMELPVLPDCFIRKVVFTNVGDWLCSEDLRSEEVEAGIQEMLNSLNDIGLSPKCRLDYTDIHFGNTYIVVESRHVELQNDSVLHDNGKFPRY